MTVKLTLMCNNGVSILMCAYDTRCLRATLSIPTTFTFILRILGSTVLKLGLILETKSQDISASPAWPSIYFLTVSNSKSVMSKASAQVHC